MFFCVKYGIMNSVEGEISMTTRKIKNLNLYRKTLGKFLEKAIIKVKLETLNEPMKIDGPVIYVANHSSMYDVPIAIRYIKEKFILLAGKENLNFQAKLLFGLNGVKYIERHDRDSRKNSLEFCINKLNKGKKILVFPEATWNLEANQVILPLRWGIVEMAQKTGAPIIPMIFEYDLDECKIKSGEPIFISKDATKEEAIEDVRGVLGKLRWDIWEENGINKRENVNATDFDNYVQKRLDEFPCFNPDFEKTVIFKKYPEVESVEDTIKRLEITKKNAFLLRK